MEPDPERELPQEILDLWLDGTLQLRSKADWAALYNLLDQGLPSKDIILQFDKRFLREEDSTYPLSKLLAELDWDVGSCSFEDLLGVFRAEDGSFCSRLTSQDYEVMQTIKEILDRLSHFSLSHFCEINGWRQFAIHDALFNDTAQLQVAAMIAVFTKTFAEGNMPLDIDPYQSESALRLARSFFNLRGIKDDLLHPAAKASCLRDDPDYVASHPMTVLSGEPLLVAQKQGELILTKLSAPFEERELVLLSPPEVFTGTLTSLRTNHSTFIAATTQRVKDLQIQIWDLHNIGSCPVATIPGHFVDCLLFRRPGDVAPQIAAITADGQLEICSVQGERLSLTSISEQLPRGSRHDYTLLFAHFSEGDERLFIRTDKQVASVSLGSEKPQVVVSAVLSKPHQAMSPRSGDHFWSVQDCCLTSVNGRPVLAVLRKDNTVFLLDPDTLQQVASSLRVCEDENYGMCLVPNCLGFELMVGKLSCTPRLPVVQGVSLGDRKVTPIEIPQGDIVSIVPLSGDTQPGVFVGGSYAPPTVVTLDSRGQFRADTLVPVRDVRYLTVI